jgi:hypothetical protein
MTDFRELAFRLAKELDVRTLHYEPVRRLISQAYEAYWEAPSVCEESAKDSSN